MFEFSLVVNGNSYGIDCYNRKNNTMYLLFSSPNRSLVHRLYGALLAADSDQIAEIVHGWTGSYYLSELQRIEEILNRKKNLFFEPKSKKILNIKDVYKQYKQQYYKFTWSDYLVRRKNNQSLTDYISLLPEGGKMSYAAQFV